MYSGYVTLAYFWARMAVLARKNRCCGRGRIVLRGETDDRRFCFDRLLPRALSHKTAMVSGPDNLMEMPVELFELWSISCCSESSPEQVLSCFKGERIRLAVLSHFFDSGNERRQDKSYRTGCTRMTRPGWMFIKRGVNAVERKPFRPLRLLILLIVVVMGLSIFSQYLAHWAGVY